MNRPEASQRSRQTAEARRPTLKDVAALSGVSPMTVSNVINGRGKGYNTETRDKVLWAVRRTNYRPDIAARSLRTDRRMAVGMLVVQEAGVNLVDPYITNLLDGLCAGLNQHGYSMVLQGLAASEIATAPLIRQRHGDGLCILTSSAYRAQSGLAELIGSLGQPVVLFQQPGEDIAGDVCVLSQDDFEGGRRLCAHLLERGAQRLVLIIPQPEWPAMQARLRGVREEIARVGSRSSLTVLTSIDESAAATQGALAGFMSKGATFDAVIAGNDQMAIAAYRLLTSRGIRVPQDVKLTGFNGFAFLDYFEARLTTVRSPAFQLGTLGAHHMIRRLDSGQFETRALVLPVEFVPGETT
jgi:LacI family transcriptional regulator